MLTDTHAHLFWESFEKDFDEMIQRTIEAGVTTIINVGTDLDSSRQALLQVQNELANFPKLTTYSSIGIHPHDAIKFIDEPEKQITDAVNKLENIYHLDPKKVVAVGECGLDFIFVSNPDFIPASIKAKAIKNSKLDIEKIKDLQKMLLKAQVDLAKKLNLPLLIHTREAWDEIFDLVTDHYGLFHCYSGDVATTQKVLRTNFLISFAATISYPKNESLRQIAKNLPLDRFVLETDCPFLPPQSKRGTRNEPNTVLEIGGLIAELKGTSLKEVACATSHNAKKLFKLT
ncbi:TatD family hydrolase [Candidatus Daviesbacteria bacterium]|nr:TatD family hydrolase [Candidatus Daviesbacteria bacterium]